MADERRTDEARADEARTDEARAGGGDVATARGRGAVGASIIAGLLIGGYFAASTAGGTSPRADYLVNAVVLTLAFWFPSQRIGSASDVLRSWLPLVVWLLAWTLVWDLATSGIIGERALFEEWWIVYPAGVVALLALLALHGWVVGRVGAAPDR